MNEKTELQRQLIKAMTQFDENIEHDIPSLAEIESTIINREKQHRKQYLTELLLFMLSGCLILVALMTILVEVPVIFLIIQLTLLIFIPYIVRVERQDQHKELF